MELQHFFAGVAVARLPEALAWYERFLGRPPDMFPNDREAVWQVTGTASIYVVADADRAGKSLLTLMVEDLDQELAAVGERGIAIGAIETASGLYRKTVTKDPEGNVIQLGEALSAPRA